MTSKEQIYQSQTGAKQLQSIKQTYKNILNEFAKIQKTSKRTKGKQSKKYIDLFEKMLTMMRNQYNISNNKYYTVDIEQQVDNKCLLLTQQLSLHRKQCNDIQQKLVQKKKQLLKQKNLQRQLENEKAILLQGCNNKEQQLVSIKQYVKKFRNRSCYQQKPIYKLQLIHKRNNSLSMMNPQNISQILPKFPYKKQDKNFTQTHLKKNVDRSTMNSFMFQSSPRS